MFPSSVQSISGLRLSCCLIFHMLQQVFIESDAMPYPTRSNFQLKLSQEKKKSFCSAQSLPQNLVTSPQLRRIKASAGGISGINKSLNSGKQIPSSQAASPTSAKTHFRRFSLRSGVELKPGP
ncbi:unnamed protein product [Coffea canephora]|uniref:Uncharacterized protein n=1 Tax=Coffea canephora TaxID=49390 RepID=A0A068VB81_COFCA|nr:unnamed protein product [Coffea canephora]